jgi:hypothetical protein
MKKLEAIVRTSEFWAFLAQCVIAAMSAPVPEEIKTFGWCYIALRVLSKIVKYKPAAPVVAAPLLALMLLGAPARVAAQSYSTVGIRAVPLTDFAQRFHAQANGGAMVITTLPNWSGASLGGSLLYNLHPKLSLFAGYDHGFPVSKTDPPMNLYRLVGSVRVHPNAFVGFGYAWFDKHTDGALAQLAIVKNVMPRLDVGGLYAHVMSRTGGSDFEYVRAFLNYHLLGRDQ